LIFDFDSNELFYPSSSFWFQNIIRKICWFYFTFGLAIHISL